MAKHGCYECSEAKRCRKCAARDFLTLPVQAADYPARPITWDRNAGEWEAISPSDRDEWARSLLREVDLGQEDGVNFWQSGDSMVVCTPEVDGPVYVYDCLIRRVSKVEKLKS